MGFDFAAPHYRNSCSTLDAHRTTLTWTHAALILFMFLFICCNYSDLGSMLDYPSFLTQHHGVESAADANPLQRLLYSVSVVLCVSAGVCCCIACLCVVFSCRSAVHFYFLDVACHSLLIFIVTSLSGILKSPSGCVLSAIKVTRLPLESFYLEILW